MAEMIVRNWETEHGDLVRAAVSTRSHVNPGTGEPNIGYLRPVGPCVSTSRRLPLRCVRLNANALPRLRIARTIFTLSAASLALTIVGCTYSPTQHDSGAYRAAVDHPHPRSPTLLSASEHHHPAAVKGQQPQQASQPAPGCALRPYPDVCRFSPAQSGGT
jgi:hypothetical protein